MTIEDRLKKEYNDQWELDKLRNRIDYQMREKIKKIEELTRISISNG